MGKQCLRGITLIRDTKYFVVQLSSFGANYHPRYCVFPRFKKNFKPHDKQENLRG